jgi:hypothetical protein
MDLWAVCRRTWATEETHDTRLLTVGWAWLFVSAGVNLWALCRRRWATRLYQRRCGTPCSPRWDRPGYLWALALICERCAGRGEQWGSTRGGARHPAGCETPCWPQWGRPGYLWALGFNLWALCRRRWATRLYQRRCGTPCSPQWGRPSYSWPRSSPNSEDSVIKTS